MSDHFRKTVATLAFPLLFMPACSREPANSSEEVSTRIEMPPATAAPSPGDAPNHGAEWDLVSSGEGAALVFPATGTTAVRLFCPTAAGRIVVNVTAFRPIGSEERLTFGSGGNAHALVADSRGDHLRGGVSGTGPVPANLAALISGSLSVSYGAQTSGPHPAASPGLAREFVLACRENATAPAPIAASANSGPCFVQDGEQLSVAPLRAVGTEPFWGATIEGRCVTYSHPEDQQGTRVWTKYSPRAGGGGSWIGALSGRPFALTTRPQAACSDGMSDRSYPIAVDLTVGSEKRTGCAETR